MKCRREVDLGLWHEFGSPGYERLIPQTERLPGSRAAIVVHVHKVGTVSRS